MRRACVSRAEIWGWPDAMIFAIFNVIRMVLGLVLARLSATRDHTATARSQVF